MTVDLSEAEWNAILNLIAMGPWREANPLLMKIGEQMRAHAQRRSLADMVPLSGDRGAADGKEANHG